MGMSSHKNLKTESASIKSNEEASSDKKIKDKCICIMNIQKT